jgi:uncharacterized protein (TIGR00251 family)
VSSPFLVPAKDGTLVKLRVSPGAKRTEIRGAYGEDALKIGGAAPPVDGKANTETERFVAGLLGIPRSEVKVVRGAAGRDKAILAQGVAVQELEEALSAHLS